MATPAGARNRRVRLERRALDENGDRAGDWGVVGPTRQSARIKSLTGGEAVQAARLQGSQPVVVFLQPSALNRAIDNSYRLVDAISLQIFDITSATVSEDRSDVEVLATAKSGDLADA
jgi:hypothetical protein